MSNGSLSTEIIRNKVTGILGMLELALAAVAGVPGAGYDVRGAREAVEHAREAALDLERLCRGADTAERAKRGVAPRAACGKAIEDTPFFCTRDVNHEGRC